MRTFDVETVEETALKIIRELIIEAGFDPELSGEALSEEDELFLEQKIQNKLFDRLGEVLGCQQIKNAVGDGELTNTDNARDPIQTHIRYALDDKCHFHDETYYCYCRQKRT